MKLNTSIALIFMVIAWFGYVPDIGAQNAPVLTFMDSEGIHLRWQGYRQNDLAGYNVYRQVDGSTWTKVTATPNTIGGNQSQLEAIMGYKTNLFYALLGKDEVRGNIGIADVVKVGSSASERSFFEAICLINPEFGVALGEVYVDGNAIINKRYRYKITTITAAGEKDFALSEELTFAHQKVPTVNGLLAAESDATVELTWDKLGEEMKAGKVVSYNVYRSDSEAGDYFLINGYNALSVSVAVNGKNASPNKESFVDKYLQNGKPYFYRVKAINAFGVEGSTSITVRAVPRDTSRPIAPTALETVRLGATVRLTWSSLNAADDAFSIYTSKSRNTTFKKLRSLPGSTLSSGYLIQDIDPGEERYVYLTSVSQTGLESLPSDTLRIFTPDTKAPAAPTNVVVVAGDEGLIISWKKNSEKDILGYFIERSTDNTITTFYQLNDEPITGTTFTDKLPEKSQRTYAYAVVAVDKGYNRSAPSKAVTGRMPDHVAPQAPIITSVNEIDGQLEITWTKSIDGDLAGYVVMVALEEDGPFDQAVEVTDNHTTISLEEDGDYFYFVQTADASGNLSEPSNTIKVAYQARRIPDAPASGKVEKQGAGLLISWSAVTHEGVSGYVVTRKNLESGKLVSIAELGAGYLEFFDVYGDQEGSYEYLVKTYDSKWRMSKPLRISYEGGE